MISDDIAREHVAYRLRQGLDYRDIVREVGASFPPWSEPDRVDVELIVADAYRRLRQQRIEAEIDARYNPPPKPRMTVPDLPPAAERLEASKIVVPLRRLMAGR